MTTRPTPPSLESLCGEWLATGDIPNLHSLRNQSGQAHVNADLTSLSWLAIPPFVGGYHTGVLRVDGVPLAAERMRWSPWGVERVACVRDLQIHTDTRFAFRESQVLWQISVRNTGAARRVRLTQELLACVAYADRDWGWTNGMPWNAGYYHDYFTTERLRNEVTRLVPRQVQFAASDLRLLRLGRARIPGIQRDENGAPMLIETELPDHSPSDSGYFKHPGAPVRVGAVVTASPSGEWAVVTDVHTEYALGPDVEHVLGPVRLGVGARVRFAMWTDDPEASGVILTHGNHPDSLLLLLDRGRLGVAGGGERVLAGAPLRLRQWVTVEVEITDAGLTCFVDGVPVARTEPWWSGQRWQAQVHGTAITTVDSASAARSAWSFTTAPDALFAIGTRGEAEWFLAVPANGTVTLGMVWDIGVDQGATLARAEAAASAFEKVWENIPAAWNRTWAATFTPDNDEYSGYLPVLETDDADLARTYYLGVLLAVYLRNVTVSPLGPVMLTGGPRLGPTTSYFWDQNEWATTYALLDPAATRVLILASLAQPYWACHSFDTRNLLATGNYYSANEVSLFHLVDRYLAVTGDIALLDESAGGRTVWEHLVSFAELAETRRSSFGDHRLMDFGGDSWTLLECVPNYRHTVVSFNAGFVALLRGLAGLARQRGEAARSERWLRRAEELAAGILDRFVPGGRWVIQSPAGEETIGHCLDFQFVATSLTEDLPPTMRDDMVDFVTTRLIDGDWMRALDPDDPIAPQSDRPDHGAAGAFAAWPAATAIALCALGHPQEARGLLQRAHRATSGALWGQAMEAVGDGRYRVAERGISVRECCSAVSVVEAVLIGLFGIRPAGITVRDDAGAMQPGPDSVARPGLGTLHGVNAVGYDG